ncbi:MAG: hypothetical protein COB85_08825 [Bacteroidetes bacterium]|nr:MAG: hypothetical protein COB85_08825 [Bacteroidota bacterium]
MKKLYSTLIVLVCFAGLSISQPYDFGVTAIVDPIDGSSLEQNFNDTMQITVFNFGPDLMTTDSVVLRLLVDGILTNVTYYIIPGFPFPSGVGATIGWQVDLASLGLSLGSHSLCWTIYMGSLDTNSLNDSTCVSYTFTVTGIESALEEQSKIFFANGQLNIDVTNPKIKGSSMLSVYNMAGMLVFSEELTGNGQLTSRINLSNHSDGVYIFRLTSDGNLIESRKLLKH